MHLDQITSKSIEEILLNPMNILDLYTVNSLIYSHIREFVECRFGKLPIRHIC